MGSRYIYIFLECIYSFLKVFLKTIISPVFLVGDVRFPEGKLVFTKPRILW